MSKAVLISIRPKWGELIASGKKTIEVRKTRPKLETPFKCYIYCTLSGSNEFFRETCGGDVAAWNRSGMAVKKGMVIGEFVCSGIFDIMVSISKPEEISPYLFPYVGLTDKEIMEYIGNGKTGYGWHISNLKIYDEPKALSEFHSCSFCDYRGVCPDGSWCQPLKRPPQSWCYVEEVNS